MRCICPLSGAKRTCAGSRLFRAEIPGLDSTAIRYGLKRQVARSPASDILFIEGHARLKEKSRSSSSLPSARQLSLRRVNTSSPTGGRCLSPAFFYASVRERQKRGCHAPSTSYTCGRRSARRRRCRRDSRGQKPRSIHQRHQCCGAPRHEGLFERSTAAVTADDAHPTEARRWLSAGQQGGNPPCQVAATRPLRNRIHNWAQTSAWRCI